VAVVGLAAAALLAVLGLPYGKSNPEAFAHAYTELSTGLTAHLEIDAIPNNGTRPCEYTVDTDLDTVPDALDTTATVAVGSTHTVAICFDTYKPNDVQSFQIRLVNNDALNFAPDPQGDEEPVNGGAGPDCGNCVDDNPDANQGPGPNGLGQNWDCTGLGQVAPRSETLPIEIVCNARLTAPLGTMELAAQPGLLATVKFRADKPGKDTISFLPWTSIGMKTDGQKSCGDVPENLIGCFGATINKVADLGIVKTVVTSPVVAPGTVTFNLALSDNTGGPTAALVFDDIKNSLMYNDAATDAANGGNVCDPVVNAAPAPVPGGDSGLMPEVVCGDTAGLWAAAPTDPIAAPGNIKIVADVPLSQAGKGQSNAALLLPPDPNMANNVGFVQFAVAPAVMTITDVGSPPVNSVGDTVTWTVTATSTGASEASGVVITKTVDANQCITAASLDVAGGCVISDQGTCGAGEGHTATCTVTNPVATPNAAVATILAKVVASDKGPTANACTNAATVEWADPSASTTGSVTCLPPTVRMEKDIDTDASSIDNDVNLFIQKDGSGGFVPLTIYELVSNPGNDPDGVGAYEFQLKFDHKIFDIAIADTSWLSNGGARTVDCSMTIITENDIRWGCVSQGPVPGQVNPGVAAIITVYPEPDMYLRLTPGQENGVFRMLLDENCELADVLGDPLRLANGDLAPGILPGGLVEVCSDMGITVRILEGDLNLDCVVDLLDEQAIAFRYGAVFGTLYYDPWYDLEPWNKDYDIDIKDLQKVWGRQGSACSLNGEGTIPPQLPVPVPDP
jgi:uncharacterized repeat protein (TIGR01451 family)